MSSLFIALFTILLILDCLFLGLLVLMQLPKKDAGVGMAFGGGAADALFGAGSGNLLTKLTKYTALFFFVLVLILSILKSHAKIDTGTKLKEELGKTPNVPQLDVTPTLTPTNTPTVPLSINTNMPVLTNTPPATNVPTATAPGSPK